jgi:hypothetical protein
MLRDRYDPMNLFDLVSILGLVMDPVLTQLDTLLDDDRLFQMVKADVAQRFPHTPTTGRPSTPVEVILRMLIVKHLYVGVMSKPSSSWLTAWCCASFVGSMPSAFPTTPP